MRTDRESSADRLWKEKLDSCASSPSELIILLILAAAMAAGVLLS